MAGYVEPRAANDMLHLIITSYCCGVIGRTIYLERLSALAGISPIDHPATEYAVATLHRYNYEPRNQILPDGDRNEPSVTGESGASSKVSFDEDGLIQFMTTAGGLGEWVFQPFDDDFFPSVPHGHLRKGHWGKLDAYLGWVYDDPSNRSRQSRRVSRESIVALWNDDDFREIAACAIDYYVTRFPKFRWRVENPRKLPAKRK